MDSFYSTRKTLVIYAQNRPELLLRPTEKVVERRVKSVSLDYRDILPRLQRVLFAGLELVTAGRLRKFR